MLPKNLLITQMAKIPTTTKKIPFPTFDMMSVAPLEIGMISISPSLPGQGEDPVDESREDGHGVETPDGDALDHLGHHGADLDPEQGPQEHAHGQGVKDEAVNRVLAMAAYPAVKMIWRMSVPTVVKEEPPGRRRTWGR